MLLQLIITGLIAVSCMFGAAFLNTKIKFAETEAEGQKAIWSAAQLFVGTAYFLFSAGYAIYILFGEFTSTEPVTRISLIKVGLNCMILSMLFSYSSWLMLTSVFMRLVKIVEKHVKKPAH